MTKNNDKKRNADAQIAFNRKARHDYAIEETYEAGIALTGWEVKSLRAGRIQLNESYVLLRDGEAYLFGCHITALPTASTHVDADPTRTRKLLLHRIELSKLIGAVERKGYALIPLAMYWQRGRAKLSIGLAKGKKAYDKRQELKERDWRRDKERLLKRS